MIKRLAHVCFTVKDLDKASAFYTDLLGMEQAFDFINEEAVRFGVYLHVGENSFVELFQGDYEEGNAGSYKHFCLEVENLEEMVAELRDKGLEVTDPKLGMDQSWQSWLADPDGNRIELHQYTPESKQRNWRTD